MAGHVYMTTQFALSARVPGMLITDDPVRAGFDWHHLYRDQVNPRLRRLREPERTRASLDRLPYYQRA